MSKRDQQSEPFAIPANELRVLADMINDLCTQRPPWVDDSVAASDMRLVDEFAALPFGHPVSMALITPLTAIQFTTDHLYAAAAILRTPGTAFALLTTLRTCLGAAAIACYTADATCSTRERVRRATNVLFDSDKEMIMLAGVANPAAWEFYDTRRVNILTGAFKSGWSVTPRDFKSRQPRVGN